jgi:hypothetical protein
MKKPDLTPYLPPGEEKLAKTWLQTVQACWFLIFIGEFVFLVRYFAARATFLDQLRNFMMDAQMKSFATLASGTIWIMVITVLAQLIWIPLLYSTYYRGGKSIYLMRRLPHRWEKWKRTATLPLISTGGTALLSALLLGLDGLCYWALTPKGFL